MCGLFGLVAKPNSKLDRRGFDRVLKELFSVSQMRGSEATGVVLASGSRIEFFKSPTSASELLSSKEFKFFVDSFLSENSLSEGLSVIGHSRLVTNGSQGLDSNNQPVASERFVAVHNGIIVNVEELWEANPDLKRIGSVDTEFAVRWLDRRRNEGGVVSEYLTELYSLIDGETNLALLGTDDSDLYLSTNTGSIFYSLLNGEGVFLFASEAFGVREVLSRMEGRLGESNAAKVVGQLKAGLGARIGFSDLAFEQFSLSGRDLESVSSSSLTSGRSIVCKNRSLGELRRCVRCLLPHTFPNLVFDEDGVCSICLEHEQVQPEGKQSLLDLVEKYRKPGDEPDCIVALSGGRDSCYGLHYIREELGLKPIAYTYDWAMVTDEARKNCAAICSKLQIEHIVRSADILKKRRNIRYNIDAWLKRPDLGMIPLFMAGDKQFFHYANTVSKETNLPLVFFCGGNNLEITRFKTGFCGIQDKSVNTMVSLDSWGKMRLALYYLKNYLLNPSYLNRSIFDTLFAFYSTYLNRGEFVYLYKYIDWNEGEIDEVLSRDYGWVGSSDSASTWRIGDGTASFYNYIYHTVAGFSEHDTFRSNQIRAGLLDRETALKFVERENRPRFESMQEYANLVGFSLDEALSVINRIPKLY